MTTAANTISLATEYAAATLADCPAFQAWVGAANATAARKRIHVEALPPPADGEDYTLEENKFHRPFAILNTTRLRRMQIAQADEFHFGSAGGFRLYLEQDVCAEISEHHAEVFLRFYNDLGAIIDELCNRAGKAGFLAFRDLLMENPASRSHPDDYRTVGDCIMVELMLEWESE